MLVTGYHFSQVDACGPRSQGLRGTVVMVSPCVRYCNLPLEQVPIPHWKAGRSEAGRLLIIELMTSKRQNFSVIHSTRISVSDKSI